MISSLGRDIVVLDDLKISQGRGKLKMENSMSEHF